jgi:hypothetical protein
MTIAVGEHRGPNAGDRTATIEALGGLEDDGSLITTHPEAERPWTDAAQRQPAIKRVRERYVEVRRNQLNKQNTEAEAARSRIKTRPGFAQLDPDQAHRGVLRPITEAQVDTTAEAISPTLVEVRDRFTSRIRQAEDTAIDLLRATASGSFEASPRRASALF